MILIFGGAYQGKRNFAEEVLGAPEEKIIHLSSQEEPRKILLSGEDLGSWIEDNKDSLRDKFVIIQDVSQGLVPMEAEERAFREANGRTMIKLAEMADEVYRVFCGIGTRIK